MNRSNIDGLKVLISNRNKLKSNIKVLDKLIKDFSDSELVQDNLRHIKEDRQEVLKRIESNIKSIRKSMRNDIK